MMNKVKLKREQLLSSNVFRSDVDLTYYMILSALHELNEPTGSWVLKDKLDAWGLRTSTATIGRYLKDMDSKGLTSPKGNLGREITDEGIAYLDELRTKVSRAQVHNTTTKVMTAVRYDELVDLYVTRKSLEIEAARIAATAATEDEISKLTYSIMRYRQCARDNVSFTDPALNFHLMLAESTKNKFIFAVLNLLIYEQKNIENQFDVLETRDHALEYAQHHEDIVMAISNKDGDLAARLMGEHMDEMIILLKEQLEELKQIDKQN